MYVIIKLKQLIGIDGAIFITLLARGWGIINGLVSIFLVTHYLTPEIQGYYYTFGSILALQLFFELGLSTSLIQMVSHEMAHLQFKNGILIGDHIYIERMCSIVKLSLRWMIVGGVVFAIILVPLGVVFFAKYTEDLSLIALPWVVLVIFTAANLVVNMALATIEGCNQVKEASQIKLYQGIIISAVTWPMLGVGGGLLSFSLGLGLGVIAAITLIKYKYAKLFNQLLSEKKRLGIQIWRKEIWPMQWRIGLSWISGYFVVNMYNPLILAYSGAIEAGKFGLSIQIISAMITFSMVWMSTKSAAYGQHIARSERSQLDALFKQTMLRSIAIYILATSILFGFYLYLSNENQSFVERLLGADQLFSLSLIGLCSVVIFSEAIYLRAHKEEPLMKVSLLNAMVTAILAVILIPRLGANGAVIANGVGTIGIGLVGCTLIFMDYKKLYKNANN